MPGQASRELRPPAKTHARPGVAGAPPSSRKSLLSPVIFRHAKLDAQCRSLCRALRRGLGGRWIEAEDRFPGGRIPNAKGAVLSAAEDGLPIGRDGGGEDVAFAARE